MSEHSVHVRHLVAVPQQQPEAMSHAELEHVVELLGRLLGELARRGCSIDAFERVDEARMVALGLMSVTP